MNLVLSYIIKVVVCSGLFMLLYMWKFHKKTHYKYCRMFLLSAMLLSAIIPALNVPLYKGDVVTQQDLLFTSSETSAYGANESMSEPVAVQPTNATTKKETQPETANLKVSVDALKIKWTDVATVAYLIVVLAFLCFMAKSLFTILRLRRNSQLTNCDGFVIAENKSVKTPFTFLKTVFLGYGYGEQERRQIISHETSHAYHLHSVEKLAMSLMRSLFWLNPFVWIAEKKLEEVQEWQADNDAINEGYQIEQYRQTVFNQIFGYSPELSLGMANSFTKNRFLMMTRRFSNRCGLPMFFSVTLLMVLFFTFSCTQKEPVVEYEKNIIFTVDHFFDDNDGVEKRYHIASKNRFIFIEVFEDYSLKNRPNVYVAANGISAVRSIDSRQLRWVDENIPIFYDGKKISYSEFKNLETGSYKAVYYMKKMGNLSFVYVNNENVLPQFNDEIRIDTLSEQKPDYFRIGDFNYGEVFGCGGWTDSLKTNFIRIFSPYAELFLNGKPFDYNVWRKNVGGLSEVEVYRNAEARRRFGEQYKFVVDVKGSLGNFFDVKRKNGHIIFKIYDKTYRVDDFFGAKTETNQYTYDDLMRDMDFYNNYNSQMDVKTTITFRYENDLKPIVDSIAFKIIDDYGENVEVLDWNTYKEITKTQSQDNDDSKSTVDDNIGAENTKHPQENQLDNGNEVFLKDFHIDFKGQNVSSVGKFQTTLNKGTHYLFRVTRDSDASGQITAILTDANGNVVPTTIREESQDKYDFIFSCEQTGTYYLNMFSKNGQETRGTCTLYYIPE